MTGEENPWDDPPDEVTLLELGRLTWSAIMLEDYTSAICWQVCQPPRKDSTGEQVRKALASLASLVAVALRERATAWLTDAQAALESRHSVLHAVPFTIVPIPGTTPVEGVPHHYLADYGRGRRAARQHTLSVEALGKLTRQLENARSGWRDLIVTLAADAEVRPSPPAESG